MLVPVGTGVGGIVVERRPRGSARELRCPLRSVAKKPRGVSAGQARGDQYSSASMTVRTRSVFLGSVGSSDPNSADKSK